MTGDELLALCIYSEARNQPYEGMIAVGRVVRNRMRLHYQSDGTMAGTVLGKGPPAKPFSYFWDDFVDGRYTQVCHTLADAEARAERLYETAVTEPVWQQCVKAAQDSAWDSGFVGGPQFQKLDAKTVLYVNGAVSHPDWATSSTFICSIGHHQFYTDASLES